MKISIVTATFNSGATLSDTLRSLLAQTHTDFELIVADGGSTDNTADIVREFASEFGERLRWFSEPDRGLYDAMNKGIARATGEVVGMLNSDDFYTDTHVLSRVADALADPQIDACYGDVHYVSPDALLQLAPLPSVDDALGIHARTPLFLLSSHVLHPIWHL